MDLRQTCLAVVERLQHGEERQCARVEIRGDAVTRADRAKLEQVVANLVRNAIEAAGPDGAVDIDIAEHDGLVDVVVRDSGPGLAPEARRHLFEPFFTTKPSGTGLGLAVCQAIARTHEGEIRVADDNGSGAAFTLRLPLRAVS